MYTDVEQCSSHVGLYTIYNADFVIDDFGNLVFVLSTDTFMQVIRQFYHCPIEGMYYTLMG